LAAIPSVKINEAGRMASSPRVEIAPGIYARSVLKQGDSGAYQVYEVTGGVFHRFELDSVGSLVELIGHLSRVGPAVAVDDRLG
jgi:hypothetical protein